MNYTPTRAVSTLPQGTAFARYLQALAIGRKNHVSPGSVAETAVEWRSTPQIAAVFKAVVAGATTVDSDWAAPLAEFGIAQEYLALLRAASALGQLETRFRAVPFNKPVARELGTGVSFQWIPETNTYPVVISSFDTATLPFTKFGGTVVASYELIRLGDPVSERALRDVVIAGAARFVDGQLLNPSVAAVSGEQPGAITNGAGATAVTSTGATAAQITADLEDMIAAVTTEGPYVWIMRPQTFMTIFLKIPGIATPGTLLGQPVVMAPHGPQQITLVDPAEILYATDPEKTDIALSNQTTIAMTDAVDPGAVNSVSLWQTNSVAFRASHVTSWERARDGSVSYMSVSY